jgi:hypothetical protein
VDPDGVVHVQLEHVTRRMQTLAAAARDARGGGGALLHPETRTPIVDSCLTPSGGPFVRGSATMAADVVGLFACSALGGPAVTDPPV